MNLEKAVTEASKTYYEKVESNIPQVPYALLDETLNSTTRLISPSTIASSTTQSKILSTLPEIVTSTTTATTITTQAIVTNSILNGFEGKSVVGKISRI